MKEFPTVAVGAVTGVIAKGAWMMIVSGSVAVWGGVLESMLCNVKLYEPAAVGVPLMEGGAALRLKPGGKLPEATDHLKGATPPTAEKLALYGFPETPLGSAPA
jgi:hypothetical protein